jgi:Tfp pilus assembly major pilin PilA
MIIYLRIDKIINQYLPNMVDNFCSFSFDYRNQEIVKTDNTKNGEVKYTAKDMMLLNLSKLIQEIKQIEKEFNEQNKFSLLVQEKLMTNLGYELEFDLDKTVKLPELKNQFNYEIFKKDKKKIVKNPIKEKKTDELDEIFSNHEVKEKIKDISSVQPLNDSFTLFGSFTLIELLLVVGFIALAAVGVFVITEKVNAKAYAEQMISEIKTVENNIKLKYANESNIGDLDVNKMVKDGFLPQRMSTGNYGKLLINGQIATVKPISGDSYTITVPNMDLGQCLYLVRQKGVSNSCSKEKNDIEITYKK